MQGLGTMELQVRKPSLASPTIGDDSDASSERRPARLRNLGLQVMRQLRRRNAEPEILPVAGRDDLALVPEEAVEGLVDGIAMKASQYVDEGEIDDDVARALSIGLPLVTQREA